MLESVFFLGLNLGAWITIATVLAMFLSLLLTKLPEEIVFLGVIAVLGLTGILTEKECLAGFSNSSVVVVGVIFIVVAGLIRTGVLSWIMKHFMGNPKSYPRAIVRLMTMVALLSSVLSNTTVVALFVQVVKRWATRLGISPSKLLIPLSYASGMGGVCTIIGTPPNLIISGMYAQQSGYHMSFFSTTIPGLFCLLVGILSVLALRRLLPNRKSPEEAFARTDSYTVELLVPADSRYVGCTVEEAGLHNLHGGQLIELIRFDREIVSPVPSDEPLMGGDRLVFAGNVEAILSLRESIGLVSAPHPVFSVNELDKNRKLRLAYVLPDSPLRNRPVSETTFERDYSMTVVAVARHGERIMESPRDIKLSTGDSLLLECSPRSEKKDEIPGLNFTDVTDVVPDTGVKTVLATLILIAMVLLSSLKLCTLLQSSVIAAIAMLVFRCCSPHQAMRSIDWSILMVFAGSVVIGNAIEKTGIATMLANEVLGICGGKPFLVMAMMCLTATFVTEFISNTAAGAIFFPIVYQSAMSMGCDPLPFLLALMVSVSSSFATPIGSPTHLLVYGPGGYRFSDFMRIGLPMNIIILAANLLIINILYPL